MAASREQELRREIGEERALLAKAVDDLRAELGEAADLRSKLGPKLPLLAGGAFVAGFVKAGGIGATARLLMRRSRDGREKLSLGPYRLVGRR